jgi:programmed cell death 6-interacting protein
MVSLLGELKADERDCSLDFSTLQSLNLPGSIQALERPVGLPPSLLRKAEDVDSAGGIDRVRTLLGELDRLSRADTRLLSEVSGKG